jgi:iron complex outermembrane recepter protein
VVRFESRRPSFEPDGYLRVGYGRWDTANIEAAVGGPVGDRSAVRLSGLYQRRDDFSRNIVLGDRREGFEDSAFRGQWLVRPGDDFEALLQVRTRDLDGGSQVYRANSIVPGTNDQPNGFDRFELSQDARPSARLRERGANLQLTWDLGAVELTSISAYESVDMFARGDVDGGFGADFIGESGPGSIPFPAESGDGIPKHRQLTQEFRVASQPSERGDWQAGLFYFDESLDIKNVSYDTLSGSVRNGLAYQQQDNQAYAAFVAGGFNLGSEWRLGAGLRYTHDRKEFWAEREQSPIGGGPLARIRLDPSDDNLSGDVNVRWQPDQAVTLHARVATGFRAPSIQGRVLFGDTVSVADSETIVSGELGASVNLLDERVQLDLNLFRYRLNDAQMTAVGGAANFNTLINADAVDGQGAELEVRALLSEGLRVSAGVSYNHTEIDDSTLGVQPCASACTVLDPAGIKPGTVSIDGNPLPQAPEWIGYLSVAYERPIGDGTAFLQTDWSYRSDVNFFLYESREFTGPSWVDGAVRAGYRWGGDRYEFAVLSRNVLDEVVAIGGVDFNNLTAFYNEPRYLGAEFSVRY